MATTFVDVLSDRPDRRARAVGAALIERGLTGRRVLIALPPGPEFVTALLGCLYAGAVAVPVSPRGRVRDVIDDALPSAVIADGTVADLDGDPRRWRRPEIDADTLAIVQYAPTGPVRGVMLSHANLLAAATQLAGHVGMRADTGVVSYLPPYGDLGLVGGVLAPLLTGAPVTLVPPDASPADWLTAVSLRRARITFAPELAFAWRGEHGRLDLSALAVAVTGAAPRTLDRFANQLAPAGFRRDALFPAYWAPEATALVVGRAGLSTAGFDSDSLEPGRTARPGTTTLVDRGRPVTDVDIAIVDPLTGTRCPDGIAGEVWVSGPNVAVGYLGRPEASERTFCARLRGSTENYLRTGELGFRHAGGLHLAERQDVLLAR